MTFREFSSALPPPYTRHLRNPMGFAVIWAFCVWAEIVITVFPPKELAQARERVRETQRKLRQVKRENEEANLRAIADRL